MDLDKTVIRAGVNGRVEQFTLRVGDIVNPLMRPAGILIPDGAGQSGLQAGFDQIEAQIMTIGMAAEVTCVSKPFTVIPMVVTAVQDYIAAGQFRGGEQLIDPQQVGSPDTLLISLEPLYKGGIDDVTPAAVASRTLIQITMTSSPLKIPVPCGPSLFMSSMRFRLYMP